MKSTKIMISIMIAVMLAGGIYLFASGHDKEEALRGIDPSSYDIVASCSQIDGNIIVCNEGNDHFLVLNGTAVYKDKVKSIIEKDGTVDIKHTYSESAVDELQKLVDEGPVILRLWMTPNGKIDCIMIVEESLENRSETLAAMDGIEPDSYSSENIVTELKKNSITLAPANYTEENKDKLDDFVRSYRISPDTGFYHIDLETKILKDEDSGKEEVIPVKVTYSKYDYKKTLNFLGKDRRVFVWLDDKGMVKNLMTIHEIRDEETKTEAE